MENPEPDEELNEELRSGREAAKQLVRHLQCMGAAAVTIPMLVDDEKFEIIVRHVPVEPIGTE